MDEVGRLQQWPSKQPDKVLVLAYLATKFNFEATYSETDVNEILKKWHTFNDWPLLRRELYDRNFLDRDANGSNYRLMRIPTSQPGLLLVKPSLAQDANLSVKWLSGEAGRDTLRLMGSTDDNNQPSTLEAEKQRIRDFHISSDQRTWSMRYEDKTVGAVWVDLKTTSYLTAPSVHIMIGDPSMRRKGIGEAAILAIIKLLAKEGKYSTLYSRHLRTNQASAKLLAKVGFVYDGQEYSDADGLVYRNVKRGLTGS